MPSTASSNMRDALIRFIDTAGIRRKGQDGAESRETQRGHGAPAYGAKRCGDSGDRRRPQGVTAWTPTSAATLTRPGGPSSSWSTNGTWSRKLIASPRITRREIREKLKFLSFAPIVFISAKTGQRVQKLYGTIKEVHKARFVRVPTRELNEFLRQEVLARGGLPSDVKIRYIAQVKTNPPTFVMFSNKVQETAFFVRAICREPDSREVPIHRNADYNQATRAKRRSSDSDVRNAYNPKFLTSF